MPTFRACFSIFIEHVVSVAVSVGVLGLQAGRGLSLLQNFSEMALAENWRRILHIVEKGS